MTTTPSSNPKILIVGGGFGGVRAARKLSRNKNYDITLVSNLDHMAYYPQFYHTATGGFDSQAALPLSEIFAGTTVKVVKDTVAKIDPATRTVTSSDGSTKYSYDKVILALGNVTNYFGIPGLPEFSFGIKSTETVDKFRRHLHEQVLNAYDPAQSYVVIGAGPTGVELAATLGDYLNRITRQHKLPPREYNIQIVEAVPRVLPRSLEAVSTVVQRRLESLGVKVLVNKAVKGQTKDALQFENESIATRTVVWTSGVTTNPFYNENPGLFQAGKGGKLTVNEYMEAGDGLYIIGDNAATPYSGMAQTALHDADFVAADIDLVIQGKSRRKYKTALPISVIPVGKNWAVAEWRKFHLSGFLAYLLHVGATFIGYWDVERLSVAIRMWLRSESHEDTCRYCAEAPQSAASKA